MSLSLDDSGRMVGSHRWAESKLFEIFGGWVASTSDPQVRLLFDRHSQHCVWRAQQWWDRLPVLAGVDRDALTAPRSEAASALVQGLAGLEGTVARMAGAYRVALPRLLSAYQAHRELTSPSADGSTVRTLDMVGSDIGADWREGEALLQKWLDRDTSIREAANTVAGLEILLL